MTEEDILKRIDRVVSMLNGIRDLANERKEKIELFGFNINESFERKSLVGALFAMKEQYEAEIKEKDARNRLLFEAIGIQEEELIGLRAKLKSNEDNFEYILDRVDRKRLK